MQTHCGSILDKTLPMSIQLMNVNGVYGIPNIYCKWTARVPEDADTITLNFTRFSYTSKDQYSLETIYNDGRIIPRNLINNQYTFPADSLDQINIHYYSTIAHAQLPFAIDIISTQQGFTNFVGLFVALSVIILVCIVCSVFFYKYSKVIIENNRRIQERRAIENAALNNENANRQEELKKINKDILNNMFENELKPFLYRATLNDFNIPSCTVCLEEFNDESDVVKLVCKHIFHFSCLKDWLEKILLTPKCPCCNDYIIQIQKEDFDENFNTSRALNPTNVTTSGGNVITLNNNLQRIEPAIVNEMSPRVNVNNVNNLGNNNVNNIVNNNVTFNAINNNTNHQNMTVNYNVNQYHHIGQPMINNLVQRRSSVLNIPLNNLNVNQPNVMGVSVVIYPNYPPVNQNL
jgi:hypothetical protein